MTPIATDAGSEAHIIGRWPARHRERLSRGEMRIVVPPAPLVEHVIAVSAPAGISRRCASDRRSKGMARAGWGDDFGAGLQFLFGLRHPEQRADLRDVCLARGAGKEAIVPDAMEALG